MTYARKNLWIAALSCLWAAVLAQAQPLTLATFDTLPPGTRVTGGSARIHNGKLVVDLDPARTSPAVVRIPLPPGADPTGYAVLDAVLGVQSLDPAGARLRWVWLDDGGGPVRQHGFGVVPANPASLPLPLRNFRWPNNRVGTFAESRTLALIVESAEATAIVLDQIRLLPAGNTAPGAGPYLPAADLISIAFTAAPVTAETDGILVALEPGPNVSPAAAQQVQADALAARTALRRLLGPALRPLDAAEVTPILIFQSADSRARFLQNLGRHFGVTVAPPRAVGYTVQNIATALWDAPAGGRRPVFLHEAVHAVLAHEARLLPGLAEHAWLQEGLASYVQLCVYPTSIDARFYPAEFRIAAEQGLGAGRLLPFAEVIGKPADQPRYPQLAAIMAFLIDRHLEVLHQLLRLTESGDRLDPWPAEGLPPLADLESAFIAWGKDRFLAPEGPPAEPFPPLSEIPARR